MSDQNFQDQAFSGRALNAPNPHDGVVVTEDKQDNSVVRFLFENHGVRGEIMHMHEPAQRLLEQLGAVHFHLVAWYLETSLLAGAGVETSERALRERIVWRGERVPVGVSGPPGLHLIVEEGR